MRAYCAVLLTWSMVAGICACNAGGQMLSHSFEFRYVSDDPKANGETDFKGETAVFDTEQRIEFLRHYAGYARQFFNDPNLDRAVVDDKEVRDALTSLKEQPLPEVRTRIPLKEWKWIGRRNDTTTSDNERVSWADVKGAEKKNGNLSFSVKNAFLDIPPQTWRFSLQWKANVSQTDERVEFVLSQGYIAAETIVGFDKNGRIFFINGEGKVELDEYIPERWYEFTIEADIPACRYNLYIDGKLMADFVSMISEKPNHISNFAVLGAKGVLLDDIWGVGYAPTDNVQVPFTIATFVDDDFDQKPTIEGWNLPGYDDSAWKTGQLPIVHGGERYEGEDLFLRKEISVGDFRRAALIVETLDPGGEIWINGDVVAVLTNRHPATIDISEYLKPNAANLIALRVKHFQSKNTMPHAPDDNNVGWFAGRIALDLTARTYVNDFFIYTLAAADPAQMKARITVRNEEGAPFTGSAVINLYPWYPAEGQEPSASVTIPIRVRAWSDEIIEQVIFVRRPNLWTFDHPSLYRVEVVIKNERTEAVDDYVVTSGIRTVDQVGGVFRINGKPEMLNGAQIMGFRMPIDKIVAWNRCAPAEWLMRELLMIRKMNGNMMRIHVHAWANPARNINDPRIPEMSDQLGVMLIWATTAWIRTGEPWGIDFEGYPKYMRQVYNHPSIVMWEASNHPNKFKQYDFSESNRFYEMVYSTIYPVDPSRLISATTFIEHTHFGNDAGPIDWQGNPAQACPAWTAPLVTRGNQDSITGYGKEWSLLRTWPPAFQKDFLESPERAYFNFEHEESIGQPNWSLVKGKPWYHLQSYEWGYDEGSIGRKLTVDEWMESQAWQAFSAYEAMRKQRILDYDGFSWCCLHGGANSGTYKKPIIDTGCRAKLAFYTNKMAFQRVLAGSDNVDVVYGSGDAISPVILNLGGERTVDLTIAVRTIENKVVQSSTYRRVTLPAGRTVTRLPVFKPTFPSSGYYAIEYRVED